MTKAKLDYEEKDTYMVTVTATDPSGRRQPDHHVTIKVTNVDEAPTMTGDVSKEYAENGKDRSPVATFTARTRGRKRRDRIRWSLAVTYDSALTSRSQGGVLSFKSSPNYEAVRTRARTTTIHHGDGDGHRRRRRKRLRKE